MDMDTHSAEDVFDAAGNLESQFYQEGYDGGFAHGRLHGLFEGRALGQEKAWELWEEVGFYEGFAEYWMDVLGAQVQAGAKSKEARAISQARQLLDLIGTFPTTNPTPTFETSSHPSESNSTMGTSGQPQNATEGAEAEDPTDLPRLLSSIRAKYRLLCTSVGARPRLVAAATTSSVEGSGDALMSGDEAGQQGTDEMEGVVPGVKGPMKGVDTRQLRF